MTSENREQGGERQLSVSSLQSNEELASFHLQHGSDDLAGISNTEVESVRYCLTTNEHLVPQSYGQGMPFSGDVSVFHQPGQDYLNKSVSDYSVSMRNVKENDLEHAFGDSVVSANIHSNDLESSQTGRNVMVSGASVVRGLQSCKPGGECNGGISLSAHNPISKKLSPNSLLMDTSVGETNDNNTPRPWLTRNQFIGASSASASGHNPTIGELAVSNFVTTGAAQPNRPGVLDGNFLSLGCGTFEETDSKCGIHCPDSEQITGGALLPLFNTFPDQNFARGSLNCSSTMANGISSFLNCAGGYRNLTNEDPYRKQNLGQNGSGFPHQAWRANELPNPLATQNVEGSFNPMLNARRLSHQAPATNRDISSESNVGLLNAAWLRATMIPSSPSIVGFTQPASDRLQNPPLTTVRNFSPGPANAPPFIGVPGSMAWHGQSVGPVTVPRNGVPRGMVSHGQSGPVVAPSPGVLRSMPWQGQSGHPFKANTVSAAEATESSPFSKNVRVQQHRKGICDQSQASVALNPSKSTHAHAFISEQQIRQVNVPQSSTILSGASVKRGASKLSPNAPAAQRRKTRSMIPSVPSTPTLHQIAQHIPPASIKSLTPHMSHLLQNPALLPSLLRTQSTHHIKWHEEDKKSPSGYQCPICKRDLSYTSEGSMYQPDKLLPTSVLPCGHCFHSSCLLRITPADQAGNPPCIPCALD
ncbi:uncharacterized protein [Euphorbia lathyris]|uniref:uncharacterized protein isoform X2 n=1 Tax=Euphorbia lathyris TaxID=212925 RepID=UPI003313F316